MLDTQGGCLAIASSQRPTVAIGQLLSWLPRHGQLRVVGVERLGSYGAGADPVPLDHGVTVVKVDRPDRGTRRQRGKSDPMDAEAAARAVLTGGGDRSAQAA